MNINELDAELKGDGIVFLAYDGFLTQALIVAMTEALENESGTGNIGMTTSTNILTIFIELCQNMMNYSKYKKDLHMQDDSRGMILVGHDKKGQYYVLSRNLVDENDKKIITKKLEKIVSLDTDELRKYYRKMRKEGCDAHKKGAGIGFIEIARKCEKMIYSFEKVEDTYSFTIKAILKKAKDEKLKD
ncbi:MAG: hypothetical protein COA44_15310 [Arcobacter sp.]|nr:MAG: hypothetical protein COA44_15310 [Arcobacter sp.]